MKRIWLSFLLVFLIACNESSGPDVEQEAFPLSEIVERLAAVGDLGARAVIASGINAELAKEDYPLVLFLVSEVNVSLGESGEDNSTFEKGDQNLKAYLAEQGLSEEEFLAHPKLRNFVEGHLIIASVDLGTLRTTENARETFEAANDSEVVLTTEENLSPAEGDVLFANGVPVESYCFFETEGLSSTDEVVYSHLCSADAPIVEGFDWAR